VILLRLISWPYARKHLQRWLLTVAGIALGVAVFTGMHTANQSVLGAFSRTIDRIAGEAQLQVNAGEPGFDEDVLERIQALPEVRAAAAVLEATVSTASGNVLILGVDMLGDRNLRNYDLEDTGDAIDDPLVFLAQPDSLLVTKTFADKNGLQTGSRMPMRTMAGDQVFTVRGIMKPGGLAAAFGGDLAIMDIYAAQAFLGRGRKFDRIDLALQPDISIEAGAARIRATLGDGFEVEPPRSRGEHFEQTAKMYTVASNITSVFALVIGMFLIYNTFAVAVTQRRVEIGILRALGATRGQIQRVFLAESAIAGLFGSLLGAALGVLLAKAMSGYVGQMLTLAYGIAIGQEEVAVNPLLLAAAVAMGLITSLVAGVLPARAAAAVDPVRALQKGLYQTMGGRERASRNWMALAAASLSTAALVFSESRFIFYGGFVLAAVAAVLMSPYLCRLLAKAVRAPLSRILPVEGPLAADSLLQSPRRTSGTVAALMLSISLVIALGGLARASRSAIGDWMRVALNPDLFVTTAESVTAKTFVFPAALGDGLRKIAGVAEVQAVRSVRVNVKGSPVMLVAVDLEGIERRAKLPAIEGDEASMYQEAARGEAVLASEGFARLRGVKLGEVLEIPAPSGIQRFRVAGIVRDFSDQQGSLFLTRDAFVRAWNDDTVNLFRVYVEPGVSHIDVRRRILDEFGQTQRLFVLSNQEVRDFVERVTGQWFGLTYIQILVALLVAVLGIVNSLTVSIMERKRELGLLQAVGGLRGQVRRAVWTEALTIGAIGLVLGLAVGAATLAYAVAIAQRDLIGTDIGFAYPWQTALILLPAILAAAWIAALGPAESAIRGPLAEALEYE
jgi:putative ABC transport system permease protein